MGKGVGMWCGVKCGRHLFRGAIKSWGNYDALSAIAASGPVPAAWGGTEQCQPEQIGKDGIVFYNGSESRKTCARAGGQGESQPDNNSDKTRKWNVSRIDESQIRR